MKIAIIGAGGVGGYYGARLIQGGHHVAFVARGAHRAAILRDGLRIKSQLGDALVKPQAVVEDPREIGPVDFVLIAVKLWDTEDAARMALPLLSENAGVLSLQNGVEKDEVLAKVLGVKHVLGGVTYIGAIIAEPGTIQHTGAMQRIVFGEMDGTKSERAQAILAALLDAKVAAEISDDPARATWEKFAFLVGMSGATTLMRHAIGPIREDPTTRAFLLELMREAVAVGRAQGIMLPEDFAEQRLTFIDTLPAEMTSSMHGDLDRGNRLELPWLSGAVARFGVRFGVPTPANGAVVAALNLFAGGGKAA